MKIGLDSNVLVYLAGVARYPVDLPKIAKAQAIVAELNEAATLVVPTQALGELYNVVSRAGMERGDARTLVQSFAAKFTILPSNTETFFKALDLAVDHRLQFWDSLILTVAADTGCSMFLSEDLQEGFSHRGMTIVNPFAAKLHDRLNSLLKS